MNRPFGFITIMVWFHPEAPLLPARPARADDAQHHTRTRGPERMRGLRGRGGGGSRLLPEGGSGRTTARASSGGPRGTRPSPPGAPACASSSPPPPAPPPPRPRSVSKQGARQGQRGWATSWISESGTESRRAAASSFDESSVFKLWLRPAAPRREFKTARPWGGGGGGKTHRR
jgi:hypothetical protein